VKKLVFSKFLHIAVASLVALLCAKISQPAQAETIAPDFEQLLSRQYDWVLDCKMDVFEKYLSYDGSLAKGLTRFTITYRPAPGLVSKLPQTPLKYEELWYQNGKCIGMKRMCSAPFRANEQGVAVFQNTASSIGEHSSEIANAAMRLLLDVNLCHAILANVMVPASTIDKVSGDLRTSNFVPLDQVVSNGDRHLSLRLLTVPLGRSQSLFYDRGLQ